MTKNSFIILCNTYKNYNEIWKDTSKVLNLNDSRENSFVSPMAEAFRNIIEEEFSHLSDFVRDMLIDGVEYLIFYNRPLPIETGLVQADKDYVQLEKIELNTFEEVYDFLV